MNQSTDKYRFSFTAASLMLKEFAQLAQAKCNDHELLPDLLGRDRAKTGKREFNELMLRLEQLNDQQLEVLAFSNQPDQEAIAHLAFARTYKYYADFVTEVLWDKMMLFDDFLTDLDYQTFLRNKEITHPELEKLTDATKYKVKQVLHLVLEQTGLLSNRKERIIQRPILSDKVEQAIAQDNANDLALFLYQPEKINEFI